MAKASRLAEDTVQRVPPPTGQDMTIEMYEDEDSHGNNYCECCGQKIRKLNPHRMCKSKVALLEYIAKQNDWVKISTGSQRQVAGDAAVLALRLEWFGLVEHGPTRSGLYKATRNGIAFLKGTHLVPKVIWCRDSKVIEKDSVLVSVRSIKNVVLDKEYWDNYYLLQKEY